MTAYLAFQLYGPMAAWGEVAVGETRRSADHPSKSAVLGLLAAAMGIDRIDEESHQLMADAYGFAVKTLSPGSLLVDYHTVQVPPQKKKQMFRTRRGELSARKLGTLLSNRQYRCDAAYVAAIWAKDNPTPFKLEELCEALEKPKYALYLGRKSCPLAMRLCPMVIEDMPLKEVLDLYMCTGKRGGRVIGKRRPLYYSDETDWDGFTATSQFERWDVPRSRQRWQFSPRIEYLLVPEKED